MSPQLESDARHWRAYPVRAFALRAGVFLFPIAVSVVLGLVVSHLLPTPDSTLGLVAWWTVVLATSTVSVYAADKFARRLLPLATLLRLSMLFPDRAPSRLKVARRVSGSRAIAAELERAHHSGVTGNRQEAAETILALVGALGDYDSRTRGHSERTQLFVTMLADELRLKPEDRGRLMWAALVHDIGKLKVPHEVLNKPGKPTDEEWHILHSHPVQGAHICEPLREWLGEWWYAIEQHHERFDGTGYPRGLSGKQISYGARIVAVADSYEVMTAARPYKRPMSAEAARQELIRCAGAQFDPEVVRAFLNISLGDMSRWSGPIAWLAQLIMVRPGPVLGQVFGAAAGASAATLSVVGLSLAPAIASQPPHSQETKHSATAGAPATGTDEPATIGGPTSSSPASPAPAPGEPTHPGTTASTPPGSPTPTGSGPTSSAPTSPTQTGPTTGPTSGSLVLVDDSLTANEDESQRVDVLANDRAPEGESIEVTNVTGAQHGSAALTADGVISYTPAPDFHGTESLTYSATDGNGVSGTADVAVTVVSVNDPPRASDDDVTVAEDSGGASLALAGNDSDADGDSLRVTSVSHPNHGSVTSGPGGYTYIPDPDFNGHDGLSYTVVDGHGGSATGNVDVSVNSVNDPPVTGPAAYATSTAIRLNVDAAHGVLANATDADGDHLTVVSDDSAAVTIRADGSISYLPVLPTVLTVRYVVSDGTDRTTGTVRITVTLLPVGLNLLYLQPPESTQAGELDTAPPTGGISDWDDDGKPGLTIKGSNMRESEDNRDKFRVWNYVVPDGGIDLQGPITMELWTSLKGKAHEDLDYAAWVYDCLPGGGSCQRLTSAVGVHVNNWSTTTTWESREIMVGSAQETLPKDHILRVRLAFQGTDVWMPLDNAHPSTISLAS